MAEIYTMPRRALEYMPRRGMQVQRLLEEAAGRLEEAMAGWGVDAARAQAACEYRRGDPLAISLVEGYTAVLWLAGSELDTQTPGSAGLGGRGRRPDRFGAVFRTELARMSRDAEEMFGPLIEELAILGYGAAAAGDALRETGPARRRTRSEVALLSVWGLAVPTGLSSSDPRLVTLAETAAEPAASAFMGAVRRAGMITGMRKGRREKAAAETISLCVGAGAQLYLSQTALADDAFRRIGRHLP